jgi:hypothetical protein
MTQITFCSALLGFVSLSACADFPALVDMPADSGQPPLLLPIDDLVAQAADPIQDPGPALQARAARLKARAAALDAPTP